MSHFRAKHFAAGHFSSRHFQPPAIAGVSVRPGHFGSHHFASRHFRANHFGTIDLTYLRPEEDTSPGSWLASNGGPLYEAINEAARDDSDFIYTESFGSRCIIRLTSLANFAVEDGYTFSYAVQANPGVRIWVSLMSGASPIRTWEHYPAPVELTEFVREFTASDKVIIAQNQNVYLQIETEWAG
jgi:hypothetical protein